MKGSFSQSVAWLHTWAGLTAGWVLFMMFLTGTAAVFKEEINAWMTPEIGMAGDPLKAVELAEKRLATVAPDAASWTITLPSERNPATRISWRPPDDDAGGSSSTQRETLDSRTGEAVEARQTRGGDLFYRLHYRFEISNPVRRGWWLSGAATMFMLVAIVTGVLTHKRIFRDFFRFRPRASQQRAWLDAHVVLAVLLLPFHLMITYTGLVPIMTTIMPWGAIANYGDERPIVEQFFDMGSVRSAYSRDRNSSSPRREAAGVAAPTLALRPIAERAAAEFGVPVGSLTVRNPNDAHAVIEVARRPGGELSNRTRRAYFDGVTGEPLAQTDERGPVAAMQAALYGAHMGRFADPLLRWVYFIAGLASTAMIGTGLIVWVKKRRRRTAGEATPFGHSLVERLNVATIVGLPIAMAAYFCANRLLPLHLADRIQAEVSVFFLTWLATLVFAALRPVRRAWVESLWMAAFAFALVPVLNAATTDRHLAASLPNGDWLMAGFDLTMLASAALFVACARKVASREVAPRKAASGESASRAAAARTNASRRAASRETGSRMTDSRETGSRGTESAESVSG